MNFMLKLWVKVDVHKPARARSYWLLLVVELSRLPYSVPHIQEVVGSIPAVPTRKHKASGNRSLMFL